MLLVEIHTRVDVSSEGSILWTETIESVEVLVRVTNRIRV